MRTACSFAIALLLLPAVCAGQQDARADYAAELAKPAETVRVTALSLGTHVLPSKRIAVPTTLFRPVDPVNLSVETVAPDDNDRAVTLGVLWTYREGANAQTVKSDAVEITFRGVDRTVFTIEKPSSWPLGTYHAEVFLDGESAGMADFEVR